MVGHCRANDILLVTEFPPSVSAKELRDTVTAYRPPQQCESCQGIRQDDKKVYGLFYEILRYLIFLYLVLLITYGKQDINQYYINHFISQQVWMGVDGCVL